MSNNYCYQITMPSGNIAEKHIMLSAYDEYDDINSKKGSIL